MSIKLYDILGNEMATLVDEDKETGYYSFEFSADKINNLPSGVYLYRMKAGDVIATKKLMLIK